MKARGFFGHSAFALGCVMLLSSAAGAATVCGQGAVRTFSDVRFYSKDFTAACRPGGACTIITHHLDSDAPLGFSHLFGFRRETADGRWQAVLVDEVQQVDPASGMSFAVDTNKPADVAANLVTKAASEPPAYFMDAGLTELVMADAKPGDRIEWRFKTPAGEDEAVSFSLIGLTDALEWADCAQAELVSAKADPAEVDQEEPEYSGPEEGVPVDPKGRESGEPDG